MLRLKKRAEFLAVSRGTRAGRRVFSLQCGAGATTSETVPRVGFTVTKKVGTATERNRIRRRLRAAVADLPAEVSLSDADAMMPQLKLSGFPQVELVARVSRAGNAISGEWIGRGKPLSTAQSSAQALTIDGPDQPQAARP